MIHIRRLLPQESLIWKNFRISALSEDPNIFCSSSSAEEEMGRTDGELQEQLEKQVILGAFNDEVLVGTFRFRLFEGAKLAHRGVFFEMYVHPKYRGQQIENQLLDDMLKIAKKKVVQVHVFISSKDKNCFEFYRRHGFEWMAAHPRSLKIGEQFYDEEILVLKLDD